MAETCEERASVTLALSAAVLLEPQPMSAYQWALIEERGVIWWKCKSLYELLVCTQSICRRIRFLGLGGGGRIPEKMVHVSQCFISTRESSEMVSAGQYYLLELLAARQ